MNKKLKVMIVEDEFITLDNLRDILEEIGYEISGDAMNADEAIEILEEGETDIAILDINLRDSKSGLWIGQQINEKYKIPFIYLTAYSDQSTVEMAATTEPYSYLVKPFTREDIFVAIEVAMKNFEARKNLTQLQNQTSQEKEEAAQEDYIFVKEDSIYVKISLSEIYYIEAFKNYLELQVEDGRYVIRSTLKDFFTKLPKNRFVQTHRSFIVNIEYIEKVSSQSVMIQGKEISLSRTYRDGLLKQMGV